MENASKALLIAGAILIVILLIAVGMMVYNGAQGSIQKAIGSMSSTEKQIHNSQFEPYIGQNVSGSNLRTLYSKVISNNGNADNVKVSINNKDTDADLSSDMSAISTAASSKYTVTATYTEGVITAISVTQ